MGRYLLNSDAREVWQRIDGRWSLREITNLVAASKIVASDTLSGRVESICLQLGDLRLLEY
ncbi:PqqD family protein [Planosporangium flavigriseum]|uniref:PqqD family peptide modification chaperone n=1 Tax=Planosporangium flavigriseum TaxID=373681 RepID=UPI00143A6811|nr:PqqD family protein [Planosporangium flavigriseum]